ncbi:hypothetical protein SteCoe_18929 [Stentor coeruleus]|uniref:Uncharacterized protein n=1 Tax=Stentor coeruleus TaxID=5963 RepID=A0A1R2BVW2_9CILI|nr:hypothetical protein SteCoe_18929 [Stentor coeruleus]
MSCYKLDCKGEVFYKCSCSEEGFLICINHLSLHMHDDATKNHNIVKLYTQINNSKKKIVLEGLISILDQSKALEKNVISRSSYLISSINRIVSIFLKTMDNFQYNLQSETRKLLKSSKISNLDISYFSKLLQDTEANIENEISLWNIETILNLNPNLISKSLLNDYLQDDIPLIKESKLINTAFNLLVDFTTGFENYVPSSFDYIISYKNQGNSIKNINLQTQEIIIKRMSFGSKIRFPISYNLPGGLLFVGGGELIYPEYSKKYYIIDPETCEILDQSSDIERDYDTGCILYNSEIYAFGGSIRKKPFDISSKYNIRIKKWKALQNMPSPSAISCPAVFNKNILITGYEINCILSYSTVYNTYEKTNCLFEYKSLKCLLQNKERIFALAQHNVYELSPDSNNMQIVNKFTCKNSIKKSLAYKNFIYFFDNVNVFRMDVNAMTFQLIINQDYTTSINFKEDD